MRLFRVLWLGTAWTIAAFSASITEIEANGTATNNTFATAQAIPSSAFTAPSPVGVFDSTWRTATIHGLGNNGDVDFYSFTGSGPIQLAITDIPFTFSTIVSLYNSSGSLLGFSASSAPLKPGSVSTNDSYFGTFVLPATGMYFVAVTSADASVPNFPDTSSCTGFGTLLRPDGGDGGITTTGCSATPSPFSFNTVQPANSLAYTLQVSTPSDVPEPGGLAIGGLGLMLIFARKRIVRSPSDRVAC